MVFGMYSGGKFFLDLDAVKQEEEIGACLQSVA